MTDDAAPSPDTDRVLLERHGRVEVITLNRPDVLNAFDTGLYRGLTAALAAASADPGVHAVVLTGAGRAFSSGQDLAEMAALATGTAPAGAETAFTDLLDTVQSFDKPLLAAVSGAGIGLGFTILGHCDIVIVAPTARFRTPFAALGVAPEAASSYLFPVRLGWQRAAMVLMAGEWLSADDAVAAGIALRVVPAEELVAHTVDIAQEIAVAPLGSLLAIKRLMREPHREAIVEARRLEEEAFATLLFSDDTRAALDEFNA